MYEINEEEFALSFFKAEGFSRRKCSKCGSYFWSKTHQETCGEVPCHPYTFIDKPPTKRRYDLREMRIQFLDFFVERGHTRIKPYPIVARWRNDVYLVGASIYDFQPYVTEGTMPPPANPLVVSQPCVRFTDIEQVGVPTGGRHMTIFEMGGHHAFNYPNREIYWKDQTVQFHHKLLVDVMGVPVEAVTYKEHFWSGGGNAGPDLEGIVGGLEVSTLVFMKYKVDRDKLLDIPIRTVDTGYGIERWCWLSQGSPSGFHAVYGPILSSVFDLAGIHVDEPTMKALTRAAGIFHSTDRPWRSDAAMWVAKETNQEVDMVRQAMAALDSAYALTDHSKAICFLLAEGVVPSNVGEGYLARLIIRRAARLARQLGILERLSEIADAQVKYWGFDFRVLREMRNEVLEGLEIETKKYQETIARGTEAVVRLSKELSGQGIRGIPVDKLVELYDSQGIAPEIVKEGAEKVGLEVEIPDNFISLVAERHSKQTNVQEEQRESALERKLQGLPSTRPLYYEDQYKTSFTGKFVAKVADNGIVLDQTCFYPQGGGQPGDRGFLRFGDTTAKVVEVQKVGQIIIHYLDGPLPKETDLVTGEIDWSRRQNLMRHHTATHALLGAARRVLGQHVWQAGAQKEEETSRLDITHHREITDREKKRLERLVNQVILRNLPVEANWLAREKAEAKYGFRLYQGGAVPGAKIRVVTILGWDAEACGGTHCRRTGELGVFRIERTDRLQDGVERIIFSAGEAALRRINNYYETLAKTSRILGTTPERLPEVARSLVNERDSLTKEFRKLRDRMLEARTRRLLASSTRTGPVRLVLVKVGRKKEYDIADLANHLKDLDSNAVAVIFEVSDRVRVVAAAGNDAVKEGVNAAEIVTETSKIVGGGGGGRQFFASGGGLDKKKVDIAMSRAREIVTKQLKVEIPEEVG